MNFLARAAAVATTSAIVATSAQASTTGIDVMFMMDGSRSLEQSGFDAGLAFISDAVERFVDPSSTDNRVAMSLFASGVFPAFTFTDSEATDTQAAVSAIGGLQFTTGATWTRSALLGDPRNSDLNGVIPTFEASGSTTQDKIAFLITDGNPRPTRTQTVCPADNSVKNDLDEAGIRIIIIGVGDNWTPDLIDCLVDDPADIFFIDDFETTDGEDIFPQALEPTPVPLPATLPLLAMGAGILLVLRRRQVALQAGYRIT